MKIFKTLGLAAALTASAFAEEKGMEEMWGDDAKQTALTKKAEFYAKSKYAMFIHWGLYSQPAGVWKGKTYPGISEWTLKTARIPVEEYRELAKTFNPTKFDAKAWVKLAKDSGMKYIVITAKHHDGFAMYDSKASEYDIVDATPFKRDPMKELADECAKQGIGLGFYYSQFQDWNEPNGGASNLLPKEKRNFNEYFDNKVVPQVEELLSNYGPVTLIWFDTPGPLSKEQSQQLVDLVNKHQKNCLVNSRVGNGLGDYSTLGDMQIPAVSKSGLWETVDTTNHSWAYASYDKKWKSSNTIIKNLLRVAARGGNYMLNVGPKADGTIPQIPTDSLLEAGKYIRENGEAIYGTKPSPFSSFEWGEVTSKGNDLYLHIFDWPTNGKFRFIGLDNKVLKAELMTKPGNGELKFKKTADLVDIEIPAAFPEHGVALIKLTLDSPVKGKIQKVLDTYYPTSLVADVSKVKDADIKRLRWGLHFGEWQHCEALTNFKAEATASWDLRVLEAGRYQVDIEYSCSDDWHRGEWQFITEEGQIKFIAVDTGHRLNLRRPEQVGLPQFRTERIGVLDFNKTGMQTVTVKNLGEAVNGKLFIKRVILTPYK